VVEVAVTVDGYGDRCRGSVQRRVGSGAVVGGVVGDEIDRVASVAPLVAVEGGGQRQ